MIHFTQNRELIDHFIIYHLQLDTLAICDIFCASILIEVKFTINNLFGKLTNPPPIKNYSDRLTFAVKILN